MWGALAFGAFVVIGLIVYVTIFFRSQRKVTVLRRVRVRKTPMSRTPEPDTPTQAPAAAPAAPVRVTIKYPSPVASSKPEPIRSPGRAELQAEPRFIGPGHSITLFGYELQSPLVYVSQSREYGGGDASLICTERRIASGAGQYVSPRNYWPRLCELDPEQFGRYIRWLGEGRSDPTIDLGYVFIYFYGLERRALIDQMDAADVAREIIRLLEIYRESRSFATYAYGLVAHLVMLGYLRATEGLIDHIFRNQGGHVSEEIRSMIIGALAKDGRPLKVEWAMALAKQSEYAHYSKVTKLVPDQLAKLFESKYNERFGEGAVPQPDGSSLKIRYRPASPTLLWDRRVSSLVPVAHWPTAAGWNSKLRKIVSIWNQCVDELRDYARKVKTQGEESLEAFQALPESLREEIPHPKQSAWDGLLAEFEPTSGAILLPVARLVQFLGVPQGKSPSLAQSKTLAQTAESLGTPLEPDARLTGKAYKLGQHVAAIRLAETPVLPAASAYSLASMTLQLAMEIALVDGTVDEEERRAILDFQEERFALTRNDRARIRALMDVIERDRPKTSALKKAVATQFMPPQREAVGKLLVSIAGAADGITEQESKALAKTFHSLKIERDRLDNWMKELGYLSSQPQPEEKSPKYWLDLLDPVEKAHREKKKQQEEAAAKEIAQTQTVELDLEKVRAIRAESDVAAKMLLDAMTEMSLPDDEEETPVEQDPAPPPDANAYSGLRPLTQALLIELTTQDEWTPSDFETLAKKHKTSPAAVIEELNEWSDETLGDFLIDEGPPVRINVKLLKDAGNK